MKKVLAVVLALAMVLGLGITALASNPAPYIWKDGFGFHCNAANGNGKVVTGAEKRFVELVRVGATTTWDLTYDSVKDAIVCPSCKRVDWVTYSNNNGKISGKNIQVNHSDNPVYLATASFTLVLVDNVVINCNEYVGDLKAGETEVGRYTQSGTFFTTDTPRFTWFIPMGYKLPEGVSNTKVFTFEAIAGQELSATITAVKTIVIECECDDDTGGGLIGGGGCSHEYLVCANCYNQADHDNDGYGDMDHYAHSNCSNSPVRKCLSTSCTYSVNAATIVCACCGNDQD